MSWQALRVRLRRLEHRRLPSMVPYIDDDGTEGLVRVFSDGTTGGWCEIPAEASSIDEWAADVADLAVQRAPVVRATQQRPPRPPTPAPGAPPTPAATRQPGTLLQLMRGGKFKQ